MSRLICWIYRVIFGLEVRMVSDLEALEAERETLQAVHDDIEERLRLNRQKLNRQRGTHAICLAELAEEAAYLVSRLDELSDALRTKRDQIDALLKARAGHQPTPPRERRGGLVPKSTERCSYPKCSCPFDAPADPNWCARGLMPRKGGAV